MEEPNPKNMSPEQIEELKEKIKNMTPEELKDFQKKQCIFCQIISGKVQAKKVYEDEKAIAILDINPANPGHILLLPKEHYTVMPQLPAEDIAHIFIVAKFLSNAILKKLEARGTNIIVANGMAAGQRAQHFIVHVIPRKENDKIQFVLPQRQIPDKELDLIRAKIEEKLGLKEEKPKKEGFDVSKLWKKKIVDVAKEDIRLNANEDAAKQTDKDDGEFEAASKGVVEKKRPRKQNKKVSQKESPKKHEDGSINLDDISRVLGVR